MKTIDPVAFFDQCWGHKHKLYDKQKEILYSVRDNNETIVPAGNKLGKDFISAVAALWFFVSRRPAKVVTTSVKGEQLNDVLWGEIRRLIDESRVELPILYNHLKIRQKKEDGTLVGNAELVGQVVNKGESLLGRHLAYGPNNEPRTLCIFDESSGIDTPVYDSATTWAHRILIIGNPFPCENFFKAGVKAGDLKKPESDTYLRKVIKIRGIDSPNVRLAFAEKDAGLKPSNEILVPGCLTYDDYITRRLTFDKIKQTISLDAEFYEGAEVLLFPPQWLDAAERRHESLVASGITRKATHIGCDPAEGGDSSCWSVCDSLGLIELVSAKTPDTSEVVDTTIDLLRLYNVDPRNVLFDRGGGGKQHADRMRKMGFKVRTVAFGETIKSEDRYRFRTKNQRKADDEEVYVYKNRRAEMYGLLRERMHPSAEAPFAIPKEYTELRRQLAPLPLLYDGEGRVILPPKNKANPDSKILTLKELLGCSPDEADSLVLAVFGMSKRATRLTAGAIG